MDACERGRLGRVARRQRAWSGMLVWVWVSDICWVFDLMATGAEMFFYS
jgi:hypothetical protein